MEDEDNLPPQGEEVPVVEQTPEQQQPEPEQKPEGEQQEAAPKPEADPDEPKKRPRRRHDAEARIGYLTAQLHREQQEKSELARRLALAQESGLSASESSLSAALQNAQMEYKRARNEGDVDAETTAIERVAELKAELSQIKREKLLYAAPPQEQPRQETPRQSRQEQPQLSQRTAQWLQDNPWFQSDAAMNRTAMEAANAALSRGIENDSAEYWSFIDRRVRSQFPDEFEDAQDEQKPQPRNGVAQPAVRRAPVSGVSAGAKPNIRLSADQVQFAKRLGLTPQQFAAQLAAEAKAGAR